MRTLRAAIVTVIVGSVLVTGCDDEKDKAKPAAGCDEALTRARQMLAVPDLDAAKDWAARAKSLCGAEGAKPVAEIEALIATGAEVKQKKTEAVASLIPAVVQEITTYRARTDRAACKADTEEDGVCKDTGGAGNLTLQFWTRKGEAAAFSAFTTLEQRGLNCDAFGTTEVKKSRDVGDNKAYWCSIRSGPLADLELIVNPATRGTDVYVFSGAWLPHDEYLQTLTRTFATP